MEHAALHAILLSGLILSLGGPLAALLLHLAAAPASLFPRVARLTTVGALLAALATQPALAGQVVRRFSPIALGATATIFLTGIIAVLRSIHAPIAVFGSAYGLTLLVKLTLIVPAVLAGWINFRYIGPELVRASSALPRFLRMLEIEVIAGVLIITVAGVLGSVSPPGEDGSLCLTQHQARALLSPDFPTSHVDDWTAPDDPLGPTDDELRYSEMTHNWSGVLVVVLGALWLAQARGGRVQAWSARLSVLAFVPFGVFIAATSNPEVWLLRRVTPWEVLGNPILLEHQLGALPVVMIAGSLLLLGHAHSMVNIPDALSNLINVPHAIMGACGLFGGTLRLVQLRGLIPSRAGAIAWPAGVIALGIFMAFF